MKDLLGREEALKVGEALNLLLEQQTGELSTESLDIEKASEGFYQKTLFLLKTSPDSIAQQWMDMRSILLIPSALPTQCPFILN